MLLILIGRGRQEKQAVYERRNQAAVKEHASDKSDRRKEAEQLRAGLGWSSGGKF